jgi:penicillin-binding protein 1A
MLTGAYVSVARMLPSLELADRIPSSDTTKIYDSSPTPVLLAELRGLDDRRILSGDDIPQVMRDAVVALEDPRFYEHKGMDFFAIMRAAWADLRHREIEAGGSAITRQLIKNAFVGDQQAAADATLEPAIAYALESRWTKERILNEYLNYAYFGETAYGLQAAAAAYFGTDAEDLSLAQAALLAGLPASPSTYSPRRDPAAALARRDQVLNKMYQQRYISSDQLQAALVAPLDLTDSAWQGDETNPFWVDLIREQLIARYGASTVMNGGLKVITSMDGRAQHMAELAVADVLQRPAGDAWRTADALSAALVAIDVESGRLVAMVSSDGASGQQVDLATQGRWVAGSAFEPFVLATALEQGISPEAEYDAGPVTLPLPGGYVTVPSSGAGTLTLAQALADSSETVFARLMMELGPNAVASLATSAGVRVSAAVPSPAIVFEGPDEGVTPLEMATGYATLAAGGERLSSAVVFDPLKVGYPVTVVKVTDTQGSLLDDNGVTRTRVIDRGIAELLTDCLRGVITNGTGRAADIGRPAAGKDGASDDGAHAWFVGYTPELVTAVWVGYRNADRTAGAAVAGILGPSTVPEQIWARFMTAVLADTPISDFSTSYAAKWLTLGVCNESRLVPTDLCPLRVKRLFRSGEAPADTCGVHVPRAVFMPNVVGLPVAKAKQVLADATLGVKTINDDSSLRPAGVVTRQGHSADTPVLQGSEIALHVSTGKSTSVPAVSGLTLEAAQAKLAGARLVSEVAQQASDTVPAGVVISQEPASGAVRLKGSTVRITVSSGPASPPST